MGLLDLFNNMDGRTAMGLLAAAGPTPQPMSFGQRVYGLLNQIDAQKKAEEDRQLKAKLINADIEEKMAQGEQRKADAERQRAQAKKIETLLGNIEKWANPQADLSAANADVVKAIGGLPPTQAVGRLQSEALAGRQAQNPMFGIPPQAIQADLAFNEGKGLSEMIYKRGIPNMEAVNGVFVDKNRVTPGQSIPTITAEGKASQILPDPGAPGGYRIAVPPGAMEAFSGYRNAEEEAKAKWGELKSYNPVTGREEYISRYEGLKPKGSAPPSSPQEARVSPEEQAGRDQERLRILQEDLKQAKDPAIIAALQREIARVPQPSGRFAAGPNPQEAAVGKYHEARQGDFAKRMAAIQDADQAATGNIGNWQQLGALLEGYNGGKFSPTGFEIAKAANGFGIQLDPKLGNKEAANRLSSQMSLLLRNPAGGAGMPGALSDKDLQFLRGMVPNLTTSERGRKIMIQAAVMLERRNQEVAQFARAYESKYGKLDNGFFTQLAAWSKEHELFNGWKP